MKKLGPGCNEDGWKIEVICTGGGGGRGCGAPLEITKDDLYIPNTNPFPHLEEPRSVRFTCPCGAENKASNSECFTDLPEKKAWLEKRKPSSPQKTLPWTTR